MKIRAIISNTNKKLRVSACAIIAVAAAMAMYYLFMPAWVIVLRAGEDENALPGIENRFKIAEGDLAGLPSLKAAMAQADEKYPYRTIPPLTPINAGYLEGKRIVERFQMSSSYPPEYEAVLIYEDNDVRKVYQAQVVFGYEQLGQY